VLSLAEETCREKFAQSGSLVPQSIVPNNYPLLEIMESVTVLASTRVSAPRLSRGVEIVNLPTPMLSWKNVFRLLLSEYLKQNFSKEKPRSHVIIFGGTPFSE
jgi:hypothetical protein